MHNRFPGLVSAVVACILFASGCAYLGLEPQTLNDIARSASNTASGAAADAELALSLAARAYDNAEASASASAGDRSKAVEEARRQWERVGDLAQKVRIASAEVEVLAGKVAVSDDAAEVRAHLRMATWQARTARQQADKAMAIADSMKARWLEFAPGEGEPAPGGEP